MAAGCVLEAETPAGRQGRIADHLSRLDFVVFDEPGYLPFAQAGGMALRQTAGAPSSSRPIRPSPRGCMRSAAPGLNLGALAERHEAIGEVRGRGVLNGIVAGDGPRNARARQRAGAGGGAHLLGQRPPHPGARQPGAQQRHPAGAAHGVHGRRDRQRPVHPRRGASDSVRLGQRDGRRLRARQPRGESRHAASFASPRSLGSGALTGQTTIALDDVESC